MSIPTHPFSLMHDVYRKVFPIVHKELDFWRERASQIPNVELRKQALDSIEDKTFHCEGGSILSLVSLHAKEDAVRFIVAYQTISDYLDNLCDRSTSLDPKDFELLHTSMQHALTTGANLENYYALREDQDDGGYLHDLVSTCQDSLEKLDHYEVIKPFLLELCQYYCDLQIHKHVVVEERVERLQRWFDALKQSLPEMEWYEFSACSGSTLGIFCLVSYALREDFEEHHAQKIYRSYFPYIQGLHILLDYYIDQEEDLIEGDLNFCTYYQDEHHLQSRLLHFLEKAEEFSKDLPHSNFHRLINKGLIGVYLSDEKVWKQRKIQQFSREFIGAAGWVSRFFYVNGRLYRKWQNIRKTS